MFVLLQSTMFSFAILDIVSYLYWFKTSCTVYYFLNRVTLANKVPSNTSLKKMWPCQYWSHKYQKQSNITSYFLQFLYLQSKYKIGLGSYAVQGIILKWLQISTHIFLEFLLLRTVIPLYLISLTISRYSISLGCSEVLFLGCMQ